MSNRVRRVRLSPRYGARVQDVELPVILTDPGCDDPRHREEVFGAMAAMSQGHRWRGKTLMDCGCMLWIDDPDGVQS